jgi:hypothetical protein
MTQAENQPAAPVKTPAATQIEPQLEMFRISKAFWLAIFGLFIAAVLVLVLLAFGFKEANDIVAIVGLFTSVLGTLVGAFFGLQIGSAGKEQSDQRANKAELKSEAITSAADSNIVRLARDKFPEAFM